MSKLRYIAELRAFDVVRVTVTQTPLIVFQIETEPVPLDFNTRKNLWEK